MRVLIDACLPVKLQQHIPLDGIAMVRGPSWQRLKNGELLARAQGAFDVPVTMDKSIPSQQRLARLIRSAAWSLLRLNFLGLPAALSCAWLGFQRGVSSAEREAYSLEGRHHRARWPGEINVENPEPSPGQDIAHLAASQFAR